MPSPKELNPIDYKNIIRNLNGTDSAERNQFNQKGSFTYFDRLSFHVQNEKKHFPFSVTKLNIVHTGVFSINLLFITGLLILEIHNQGVLMTKKALLIKRVGKKLLENYLLT